MKGGLSKFDNLCKAIVVEEANGLPDVDTTLPTDMCGPRNCFRWKKGYVKVFACKIIDENLEQAQAFLSKVRENSSLKAKVGRFIVYNPDIKKEGGQVWMNKLDGYMKIEGSTEKDGLTFDAYEFKPKTSESEMVEGVDIWTGFQIPEGKDFKIPTGCGNNGAVGSTAFGTDWLPIVNGKFDWARSMESMKQANFECVGKADAKLDEACVKAWDEFNK